MDIDRADPGPRHVPVTIVANLPPLTYLHETSETEDLIDRFSRNGPQKPHG